MFSNPASRHDNNGSGGDGFTVSDVSLPMGGRRHRGYRREVCGEDLSKPTDWPFEVVFNGGKHTPVNPTPTENLAHRGATRADPFLIFRSTFEVRTHLLGQRLLMFQLFPKGKNGEVGYDGLVHSTDFSTTNQTRDRSSSVIPYKWR